MPVGVELQHDPHVPVFRVGDRVRWIVRQGDIIDTFDGLYKLPAWDAHYGKTATVSRVSRIDHGLWVYVRWDGHKLDGMNFSEGGWYQEMFEPLEPPSPFEKRVYDYISKELRYGEV